MIYVAPILPPSATSNPLSPVQITATLTCLVPFFLFLSRIDRRNLGSGRSHSNDYRLHPRDAGSVPACHPPILFRVKASSGRQLGTSRWLQLTVACAVPLLLVPPPSPRPPPHILTSSHPHPVLLLICSSCSPNRASRGGIFRLMQK